MVLLGPLGEGQLPAGDQDQTYSDFDEGTGENANLISGHSRAFQANRSPGSGRRGAGRSRGR